MTHCLKKINQRYSDRYEYVHVEKIGYILLVGLTLSILSGNVAAGGTQQSTYVEVNNEAKCTDFLALLRKKPNHLEFIECKKITKAGASALESKYRVKGVYAKTVEAYFVKTARMPSLRRTCCGWDALPEDTKNKQLSGIYSHDKNVYEVSMDSGETLVSRRTLWNKITYFNVSVVRYLDLP